MVKSGLNSGPGTGFIGRQPWECRIIPILAVRFTDDHLRDMKKLIYSFVALLILSFSFNAKAQSNWELGIRTDFYDFAVDATIPFKAPRIHLAAYFGNYNIVGNDFGLGGYFNWMFRLNNGPENLKFYPGVGPEIFFGANANIGVAGDFGVEYSFEFPLTIAFDWRPRVMFTNNEGFNAANWGIIARFRFGEGVSFVKAH